MRDLGGGRATSTSTTTTTSTTTSTEPPVDEFDDYVLTDDEREAAVRGVPGTPLASSDQLVEVLPIDDAIRLVLELN